MENQVPQVYGIPFEGGVAIMFVLTLFASEKTEAISEPAMIRMAANFHLAITPTDLEPALEFLKSQGVLESFRQPTVSGGMPSACTAWRVAQGW